MTCRVARTAAVGVAVVTALAALSLTAGCDIGKGSSKKPAAGQAATSSAPSASAAPSIPPDEVVANINQTPLSTTDVELATLELRRFVEATNQTWQPLPAQEDPNALDLADVMNNLLDTELRAQDARARGLENKSEVKRRLAYLQRGFLAQEWDRWQRERAIPSEEDIQKFYEQNKAGFVDPERIRVNQIVTESLSEAEAVRTKAVAGEDVAMLARNFSVGPGKENGGDVGWYLRTLDRDRLQFMGQAPEENVFFPQLEPVAFSLEIGQVSQPVKGPDNRYYVVKMEERKAARQQTELEVHDAIKDLLTLQTMQRQLDDLRKKAQVERFPERLQNVKQ